MMKAIPRLGRAHIQLVLMLALAAGCLLNMLSLCARL